MAPTKKKAFKKPAAKKASAKKPLAKKSSTKKPLAKKIAAKPVAKVPAKAVAAPKAPAKLAFKPLNDRLLISIEAASDKTAGGIIIPGTVNEKPFRGKVLAKGPGRRNKKGALRPLDVNVGDTVVFPQYAGTKIDIRGEEFLILTEEEILAITTA